MKNTLPYGTWPSFITPAMVAGNSPKLGDVQIHDGRVFWVQGMPNEKGRSAIMVHNGDELHCILPRPLSAKSKVHEYGGGAYTIHGNTVFFVLADDQRVYSGDFSNPDTFKPEALTPEDENIRFANLVYSEKYECIFAVCERHCGPLHTDVVNCIVRIPTDGSQTIKVVHEGEDFYASLCLSPCGNRLTWLSWNHPNMPWDSTSLWLADVNNGKLENTKRILHDEHCSLFQPQWSPGGDLYVVSDHNDWWNIYRVDSPEGTPALVPMTHEQGEFATPLWVFGMSTYGFFDNDTIFASFTKNGTWQQCEINNLTSKPAITYCDTEFSSVAAIACDANVAAFVGGNAKQALGVHMFTKSGKSKKLHTLTPTSNEVSEEEFSEPESITFTTSDQETAHALFYPPINTHYEGNDELPPVIVIGHGGPTGATDTSLNLKIQFWTNRGFAVADVNYRGSTGYGRKFRHALDGKWGVSDVDDVCAVVEHLAQSGRIDKNRCIIKGSSAGGYTVLAALAFRDSFQAGVSIYGIGNLETLVADTHKFEARYLDRLIGPYPQEKATYVSRSPIHHVRNIQCPTLVFQGLQDKVVPPNQAEELVNAVDKKGLPVAYVTYANEAHGFRDPENIQHMLEVEWQFYARIFSLPLDEHFSSTLKIKNI